MMTAACCAACATLTAHPGPPPNLTFSLRLAGWSVGRESFRGTCCFAKKVEAKRCNMAGLPSLGDTLRRARDVLHELRPKVAAAGHTDSMQEVDSLVAVAEMEAERKLKESEKDRRSRRDRDMDP
jgi:hypothetical protein